MADLSTLAQTLRAADPDWLSSIARIRQYRRDQQVRYQQRYQPAREPAPITQIRVVERVVKAPIKALSTASRNEPPKPAYTFENSRRIDPTRTAAPAMRNAKDTDEFS